MSLDNLDLTKAPESTEPEQEQTKEEPKDASQALLKFPGSPSVAQIETWKQQFGEVFVTGFTDAELFVFRPISRREFTNLQAHVSQVTQTQGPVPQTDVEEKVCTTCVLWASGPAQKSLETKAGSLTTLHEQIMQASNFVDPRLAGSFVIRL